MADSGTRMQKTVLDIRIHMYTGGVSVSVLNSAKSPDQRGGGWQPRLRGTGRGMGQEVSGGKCDQAGAGLSQEGV